MDVAYLGACRLERLRDAPSKRAPLYRAMRSGARPSDVALQSCTVPSLFAFDAGVSTVNDYRAPKTHVGCVAEILLLRLAIRKLSGDVERRFLRATEEDKGYKDGLQDALAEIEKIKRTLKI